jgi:hypothetical protein
MKMAHDGLFFASFREENSRSRLGGANFFKARTGNRPASANVRALNFLRKNNFAHTDWISSSQIKTCSRTMIF